MISVLQKAVYLKYSHPSDNTLECGSFSLWENPGKTGLISPKMDAHNDTENSLFLNVIYIVSK